MLLKVVNFIKSGFSSKETGISLKKDEDHNQLRLFDNHQNLPSPKLSSFSLTTHHSEKTKTYPNLADQSEKLRQKSAVRQETNRESTAKQTTQISNKVSSIKKSIRRKLRVSNNYLLEFDQLARVLNYLFEHKGSKRIKRKKLKEDTNWRKTADHHGILDRLRHRRAAGPGLCIA